MRCISSTGPKPLIISFPPSPANALAMASPMPEVEPVTSATLPSRNIHSPVIAKLRRSRGNPGGLLRCARNDESRHICNRHARRALGTRQEGQRMRLGGEGPSGNFEDRTGQSGGLGFGGGGGNMLGCLLPLVMSRFGIVGVVILLLGY